MVSNPPVEVLVPEDGSEAHVFLNGTGNNHINFMEGVGQHDTKARMDPWALRQLARQAEQAADRIEEGG